MVQYITGNETTRPERLLDTIMVRAAYETPLVSRLPHESTPHIITEWSMDEPFQASEGVRDITTPHADTRREGADFAYRTPNYPVRARTIAEIKHHGMEMSGSDRSAMIAGAENPWDWRSGQLFTKHLNSIDNTLMYGLGSPETGGAVAASGGTTTGDERRTQGLICSAAWTGLERTQGTGAKTQIEDPYGITIPASMWSVFYNANHANVTLDMFYNNLISPLLTAGADLDTTPWVFECGYRVMSRVARFLIADGGVLLNERTRNADETMGSDYLNVFRLASGHVVSFRTNRWLNDTADTFVINNQDYTPGSPTAEGSANVTFDGDQTIIGHEPGSVKILWYREPGFRDVATNGDYSRIAVVSEFALKVDHPLCVGGIGNCLS